MRYTVMFFVLLALAGPARALTPPWYYVHAHVRATFEGGPIKVLELEQADGHWVVPVKLIGPTAYEVGDALATVLNRSFLSGTVRIEVRLPDGRVLPRRTAKLDGIATAVKTLKGALAGNPHVTGIYAFGPGVLIELKPQLLQFYADNISDRHGLAHFAPADLFREFLDFSPFSNTHVFFSYDAVGATPESAPRPGDVSPLAR